MKEIKDPAIKLFGMKIPLPENGKTPIVSGEEPEFNDSDDIVSMEDNESDRARSAMETHCLEDKKVSTVVEGVEQEAKKDPIEEKPSESKQQDLTPSLIAVASTNPETVSQSHENPKTPSIDKETATPKPPNIENDQSDTNDSDQKTPKKPDKIIPCPRCNSMDTKFCYYNNYNINQPRHFCKSCQRYWTSGGTTRNVPVGAGRRKNKNSASHCRQITISEALQAAKIDVQNGINGTVISFGSDGMLCESIASVMNLVEKRAPTNGYYKFDRGNSGSCDDCSGGSSVTTSNSTEEGRKNGFQEPIIGTLNGVPCQIPCLPGVPWPYPWNLGLPMSFYPVPYWNCGLPGFWNGLQSSWSVPKLSPTSPKINQNSPNLGKHSRDGDLIKPMKNPEEKEAVEMKNLERSILVPKTLRIDDPDEAAKSSIWATLGIKNEFKSRGGLFKAFQPKGDQKNHVAQPSPALWANPAAFSRSQSFQESS